MKEFELPELPLFLESRRKKGQEVLEKVEESEGKRKFRFGGGEQLKSKREVVIPAYFGDQPVLLKVDVVESDKLPLLISLKTQKAAQTVLDTVRDVALMAGVVIKLGKTKSGHYCVDLYGTEEDMGEVFAAVVLDKGDKGTWMKALKKLHEQYVHPPNEKLKKLLMTAGRWEDGMMTVLEKVEKKCEAKICKLGGKGRNHKPVVAFPRATCFAEIVTLDLKIRHKKRPILYLIDMFTRFTVASILKDKTAATVAEVVMTKWVGSSYPVPACFHSDNGKEFCGKMLITVAEQFNAMVTTTAGRTPYQNGHNERGHSIVDRKMEILLEENKWMDEETALCWAVHAKNSMQMFSGVSSCLVPTLPYPATW